MGHQQKIGLWAVIFAIVMGVQSIGTTRLGIQGGLNFANASTDPEASPALTSRQGITGGAFFEMWIGPMLFLQGEVNYVQRGAEQGTTVLKYDYASFASLLKLSPSLPFFKPFVFIGPRLDFKLKAVNEVAGVATDATNIKSFDAGLDMGAGIELKMMFWPFNFFVEGRYSIGFLDVDDTAASFKHKGFMLLGGFIIR